MQVAMQTRRGAAAGFTLIELMVTVAVIAIIAVVAVPNMVSVVQANRLRSITDEMVASLQHARSEAIRLNAPVTVCATANGTDCAAAGADWDSWIVVVPELQDAGANTVADVVSQSHAARPPVVISAAGNIAEVTFGPTGLVSSALTLVPCIATDAIEENQRPITVLVSGSISQGAVDGSGSCP